MQIRYLLNNKKVFKQFAKAISLVITKSQLDCSDNQQSQSGHVIFAMEKKSAGESRSESKLAKLFKVKPKCECRLESRVFSFH